MRFNQEICDLIDKGMEGKGLEAHEVLKLYQIEETSKEAALLRWAGQELSLRATGGKAEIHAQIGLNSTVCPKDCIFCSFARCNNVRTGKYELPKEDVLEYAKVYEEAGANALLMLTTASYSFDKLVDMVGSVREVISGDLPLLINTTDLTLERCKELKAVGADGAYHAVRMREGIDTTIPVETRLQTFKHLCEAGLKLSSCVEPIGPEHTPQELTDATMLCIETQPMTAGCGKRIAVPGTKIFPRGVISEVAAANYVAVYRLATGLDLRLNCSPNSTLPASAGANLAWAEMGTNPRDTVERTEAGGAGHSLDFCRKLFVDAGWEVLDGPSPGWK